MSKFMEVVRIVMTNGSRNRNPPSPGRAVRYLWPTGTITADQYLAGVVGLGLLRHRYLDADANAQRMAELADVLARSDEFPFSPG